VPLEAVPQEAILFAREVLGEDRALLYFARMYGHGERERRAA
jgi:hypothetical protein